ncbi:MAG: segregation and condensation protein A [Hyphomicrobiales bacterium]
MSEPMRQEPLFEKSDFTDDRASSDPVFILDIEGFSGPLELLLELSKRQRVDLHRISILALADQYLAFIDSVRDRRIEIAADYLVMAAWLAYLKSRVMLPATRNSEESDAAELAANLSHRIRLLEDIRRASLALEELPQLGRDVFRRGQAEGIATTWSDRWDVSLYDLLSAYSSQRQKRALSHVTIGKRPVWPIPEARDALMKLILDAGDWRQIVTLSDSTSTDGDFYKTVQASSLSALMELVKEGYAEVRQEKTFGPIWFREKKNNQDI